MPTELDALFEKNIGTLAASLDETMQNALPEYEQLRQAGQKGELSHVYISFLQSGVLCKLPWLRVDLCDENDRSDATECFADWDVPIISNKLYGDADLAAKQKERMKDYELERLWSDDSEEYFRAFEKWLPQIINQCTAAQTLNCHWHFGEYLGNTVVVREKAKNEIL